MCKLKYDETINLKDNAMLKVRPELFNEWDFEKNEDLNIYEMTKGMGKKVWWNCINCKSSYDSKIQDRTKGKNCPYCSNRKVNNTNALATINPELASQWHPILNGDLTTNDITCGSDKKVWWRCQYDHEWEAVIYSRNSGAGCPFCAGQRVDSTNSLSTLNPTLAKEWHPTKNGNITPHDITCGSEKKAWWLGSCGHEWEAKVADRNGKNRDCPYCCHNPKVLIGHNDMWTTNPTQASLLFNSEDGYKYTQGSSKVVDWKCECGEIIKNKVISDVATKGLSCFKCSDGISYPEKVLFSTLTSLGINFLYNKSTDWSKTRKYDFLIYNFNNKNIIIETHGRQHVNKTSSMYKKFNRNRNEKEIDALKRELALKNDIDLYVELDCRESSLDYIVNSIMNSELINIFDFNELDWKEIGFAATKSKVVEVCEIYNNETLTQKDIAEKLNISDVTVRRYLQRGHAIGLCEYVPNNAESKSISVEHMRIEVVQLDKQGNYLNEFISIREAGNYLNKASVSSISACCKGKAKSAYGFKWMCKEDYENIIKNKIS